MAFRPEGYDATHLASLFELPNFDTVVERIDVAARTATQLMRALGITLPDAPHPPSLNEVDRHLRLMVSDAYDTYLAACREFPNSSEVDGQATDDLFDVWVYPSSLPSDPAHKPAMHVSIAMHLV